MTPHPIMHERSLRLTIVAATRQNEAALATSIHAGDSQLLEATLLSLRRALRNGTVWNLPRLKCK